MSQVSRLDPTADSIDSKDSLLAQVAGSLETELPSRPVLSRPLRGVCLGRYRLIRELGRGGMGSVWEAEHLLTGGRHALKLVRSALLLTPHARARFMREARLASAVDHPGVVRVHDVFETAEGLPVAVMDLLEGETLGDRLRREHVLPSKDVCEILEMVVDVVRAAHRAGIVHRDLKPDNIFLCADGGRGPRVRVLDFGIAKLLEASESAANEQALTETGSMLGTPQYMAPEQLYGERDVDERADVWALGVVLYECLTGYRPVEGAHVGQLARHMSARRIVPISARSPAVSPRLAACVDRLLTVDRIKRPSDLGFLQTALSEEPRLAGRSASLFSRFLDSRIARTAVALGFIVGAATLASERGEQPTAGNDSTNQKASDSRPSVVTPARPSLTIAAQVPRTSAWGRILDVWRRSVSRRTGDEVTINLKWPGASPFHDGDGAALSRLRTGQLDGAMLRATSLAKIHPDIVGIQLPGFVNSWPKVDWVREHLGTSLKQSLSEQGYRLVAWQDIGCARIMSRGKAVRRPGDLARQRIAVAEEDPLAPAVVSVISGSVPITLHEGRIGGALEQPGQAAVRALIASAPDVARNQWTRFLDGLVTMPVSCNSGALVVREAALDRLPVDGQSVLSELAERLEGEGNARARQQDTAASLRLKHELSSTDLSLAERAEWKKVFHDAAARYGHSVVSPDLVQRVQELSSEIDELD